MTRALLLLALALAGCEGQVHVESAPIAQADPTTEADWPRIAYSSIADSIAGHPYQKDSLTVTNATARTLLIEQQHVVTMADARAMRAAKAAPGSTVTVELGGPIIIREEGSYDD